MKNLKKPQTIQLNFRLIAQSALTGGVLLLSLVMLNGCAAIAVTGAVTTASAASVAVDRRTAGTYIEDEAIETKSRLALIDNKDLNKKVHVNFTSYNTAVMITGEAPTEEDKQAVVDLVKNVEKVSHVYDEMTIAAPSSFISRSADTVITTKVKSKLIAAKDLSGIHVKVVTENGVVYLMGIVSRTEGDKATEIARQTGGVQKVVRLFEYMADEQQDLPDEGEEAQSLPDEGEEAQSLSNEGASGG